MPADDVRKYVQLIYQQDSAAAAICKIILHLLCITLNKLKGESFLFRKSLKLNKRSNRTLPLPSHMRPLL